MKKWKMSLADATARTLAKRLKWYEENTPGYPGELDSLDVWKYKLRTMREAFELIARDNGTWLFTPEEEIKVERGLNEFRHYFFALWT